MEREQQERPLKKPWSTPALVNYGKMTTSTQTYTSDRDAKAGFAPVDVQTALSRLAQLPIETWSYKADDPAIRHIGPMAQDFAAAFEVGEDDRHIHVVDAAGVAFAAIQALAQITEEQAGELDGLRQALGHLSAELALLHSTGDTSGHVRKAWETPTVTSYGRMTVSTRTSYEP
jgi:hypothetical protein